MADTAGTLQPKPTTIGRNARPGRPRRPHHPVGHDRGPGEVAGVLEHGEQQEHQRHQRHEGQQHPDAGDDAVDDQPAHRRGPSPRCRPASRRPTTPARDTKAPSASCSGAARLVVAWKTSHITPRNSSGPSTGPSRSGRCGPTRCAGSSPRVRTAAVTARVDPAEPLVGRGQLVGRVGAGVAAADGPGGARPRSSAARRPRREPVDSRASRAGRARRPGSRCASASAPASTVMPRARRRRPWSARRRRGSAVSRTCASEVEAARQVGGAGDDHHDVGPLVPVGEHASRVSASSGLSGSRRVGAGQVDDVGDRGPRRRSRHDRPRPWCPASSRPCAGPR